MSLRKPNLIQDQSFSFALKVVRLYRELLGDREYILSKQVLRSGTSVGANVEEALGAQSRRDFISKMSIARKEARECRFWLRLIRESNSNTSTLLAPMIGDCDDIIRLLTAIILSARETPQAR